MRSQNKVQQVYDKIRRRIELGELIAGDRIPSIREAMTEFGVSKGTVETAFSQLELEGYVRSVERSGYYVQEIDFGTLPVWSEDHCDTPMEEDIGEQRAISEGMCAEDFDYRSWRKELTRILQDETERLSRVSDPCGEPELRLQIARFISRHREVRCRPDQIVVAAGTQILLSLLAFYLKRSGVDGIAFEHPGFRKGAQVFESCGLQLSEVAVGSEGIEVEELRRSGARVVYVSPAHQYPSGAVMSISNRMRLLKWADEVGGIILEDDYDGILRYAGSPIPALQGLSGHDNVIYLGSFSKLLSPSIRISFMVLPESIPAAALSLYNQSVGKADQLALSAWMASGTMERHLRRLRKAYRSKAERLVRSLERFGRGRVSAEGWGTGTYLVLRLTEVDPARFESVCGQLGLSAERLASDRYLLSFSGIPADSVEEVVEALCHLI